MTVAPFIEGIPVLNILSVSLEFHSIAKKLTMVLMRAMSSLGTELANLSRLQVDITCHLSK